MLAEHKVEAAKKALDEARRQAKQALTAAKRDKDGAMDAKQAAKA